MRRHDREGARALRQRGRGDGAADGADRFRRLAERIMPGDEFARKAPVLGNVFEDRIGIALGERLEHVLAIDESHLLDGFLLADAATPLPFERARGLAKRKLAPPHEFRQQNVVLLVGPCRLFAGFLRDRIIPFYGLVRHHLLCPSHSNAMTLTKHHTWRAKRNRPFRFRDTVLDLSLTVHHARLQP